MEQRDRLRSNIRAFVEESVIPAEDALDRGESAMLDRLRNDAKQAGLWALPLAAEHGGQGLSLVDYFGLAEEEGRSDYGPDVCGSASLLNARMLSAHAHPQPRQSWLPRLVRGELRISYAMTEPGAAGSDPAQLGTTAEQDSAGDWTVSGRKWFTTGAGTADLVIVVARSNGGASQREGFSMLAVPTTADGFRVVRELDVSGVGGQYEIAFDRVRVPGTHLIGEPGGALALAGERLALGRTLRALRWVGQAQRAAEQLTRRANERRMGDASLGDRQLIQQMVFETELEVRAARLLTEQAAEHVAHQRRASVEVSLAKVAAARALGEAVDRAIQVFGAEGLTAASGLPRLQRWARAARILDGADELHITTTAQRLLRNDRTAGGNQAAPAHD
jgi:acyl-CoA dehydrogenase